MNNNVLIIEDDPIISRIYRDKLTGVGYKVDCANDSEKTAMFLKFSTPDLIILDLQVAKLDGLEMLKGFRANPKMHDMPIIVLSNSYLNTLIQSALKAGATKCLSKMDCTPKQMVDEVQAALPLAPMPAKPIEVQNPFPAPAPSAAGSAGTAAHAPRKENARQTAPAAVEPAPLAESAGAMALSDMVVQAELQQRFLSATPKTLSELRSHLINYVKNQQDKAAVVNLVELNRGLQTLTGAAGIAGFRTISNLCGAIEVLVKELVERPTNINPSSIRTVAHALDSLGNLVQTSTAAQDSQFPSPVVIVVDDEEVSRRMICGGLHRANLRSIAVSDPTVALQVLRENRFELIFLDVNMPGMTGFELLNELRKYPANKTTPTVFVTALNDFETRAQSNASGGSDFIAKPFLPMELAVKALTFILKGYFKSTAGKV